MNLLKRLRWALLFVVIAGIAGCTAMPAMPTASSMTSATAPAVTSQTSTTVMTATSTITATSGTQSITGSGSVTTTEPLTATGAMTPTSSATYGDPFRYCAAVGTIDAPDARYTGPAVPDVIAEGLRKAFNTPNTPLDVYQRGSFWRCMDGKVYACSVGANLPCQDKANTDRTPTQGMQDYCQQNQNSDFIPMFVTGHNTVYAWRCNNGTPEVDHQVAQVDAQGYIAGIWHEISPQ